MCPSRSVVIGARLLAAGRAKPSRARRLFFLVLFLWSRAVDGVCALLGAVCATRCCVRAWVLCARLNAVCARRCVRLALCERLALSVFLYEQRDTRMYFFPLQIWLVAVTAQMTMNPADAAALNQTLTGLGCWQSSACQTQNFNCNIGVVRCNANGSVTYL